MGWKGFGGANFKWFMAISNRIVEMPKYDFECMDVAFGVSKFPFGKVVIITRTANYINVTSDYPL